MGSCAFKNSQKPNDVKDSIQNRLIKDITPITGETTKIFNFPFNNSSISSLFSTPFEVYGEYPSKFDQPFASKPMKFKDPRSANLFSIHKIAVSCHKGLKTCQNQDNFSLVSGPGVLCVGVFDGHGENGHEISFLAHKYLIKNLFSTNKLDYQSAFSNTNQEISEKCKEKQIDYTHSGSTSTLVTIAHNKLTVAHIGDSRAILIKRYKNSLISVPLTIDHNLKDPLESARVVENGAHIVKRFKNDVKRIYIPRDSMGIAVTRAFGDSAFNNVGVISEPCVRDIQLDGTEEFLVVASDGVWDVVHGWEIAAALESGESKKVCENYAKIAWDRWIGETKDVVDDITLVIIPFSEV